MCASQYEEPLISVIMAVYNAAEFLSSAIKSLQKQTYHRWELIAFDDVSTDNSYEILQKFAAEDSRIQVFRAELNVGAGKIRDLAIEKAQGDFIAIMDADDVSYPERFQKQIDFLWAHTDVVAVGAQTRMIDENGNEIGEKTFPTDHDELYDMMYVAIPIQQSTLMVNTRLLPDGFEWYKGWRYSEDSYLFFKLVQYGKIANMPDYLLDYRYYRNATSFKNAKSYFFQTWEARKIAVREFGYRPSFRARLVSALQYVVVSCLPGKIVPLIYKLTRRTMFRTTKSDV